MFSYKTQRWLWNEPEQLRRRYLQFNLEALILVAEGVVSGETNCTDVTKLPKRSFNKTLLMTMYGGYQLIARLPNPNAGCAHYMTASEVATMDYVCPFYMP
jgi:hypothetical protein